MVECIACFQDGYRWLSNFWMQPFILGGKQWVSVEHYFQAQKTLNPLLQEYIRALPTPRQAKRVGRDVSLRCDWDKIKDAVMLVGVKAKFKCNPDLSDKLLATGGAALVEGNTWGDVYWGMVDGFGQNKLGNILMKVRMELQNEQ